eukprot:Seg6288.3 transcript_id=Seg6288.3/GoldUCD/mRNA.D3Y31 product="Ras-related protein Rab-32D" protein_id=Seg6288.3/GoldUCD/D3Y31
MSNEPEKMPNRLLCFWKKPEHLRINVEQRIMETEEERVQRAIEVSHGSAGEFSKSTASRSYIKSKSLSVFLTVCFLIFIVTTGILLPLFWFGSVPKISIFMKKGEKYRLPVVIVVEAFVVAFIGICIMRIVRISRSVQRRASYLSSYSSRDIDAALEQNMIAQTPPSDRSDRSVNKTASLRSKRGTQTTSTMQIVALRQILEDLPTDCVERIQELAKKFLDSGNGSSSIEPGKFNVTQKISIQSNLGKNYKIAVKVMLIGDINVGKTSIFHRILYDQFSDSYLQTIGAELGFSTLYLSAADEIDQLSVGLQIWDIGGQEQLVHASKSYYKDAVIVILVLDITSLSSLTALNFWLTEVVSKVYDPYLVLLLNKADLDEKVITEDEINMIQELKQAERYEVSAKTGENVRKAFSETIAKVLIKETNKLLSE